VGRSGAPHTGHDEVIMRKTARIAITVLGVLALICGSRPVAAQQQESRLNEAEGSAMTPAGRPAADAPLPTATALLMKNDQATGGAEVWNRTTSRKMKGVYQTEDNSAFFGIEILQKAPNKSLSKITLPNGVTVRDVCDGKNAWVETSMGGYQSYTGAALAAKLRVADFHDRARLEKAAATGKVVGTEQIGAHSTYVLEYSPEKNLSSRVYFDADSGLIVRTVDVFTSPDGPYTLRLDMDDYREVDGLKFPFRIKRTEKGAVLNIRLTQVTVNPPLDDTLFLKPEFAK
jgi:zinc protease